MQLQEQHRVLDLGCGPGQLAIGFAYFSGEVIGIDPEPRMLAIAASAAEGLTPNVTFRLGSSFELDRALGNFRLVTMGRSFHWMDRSETLRTLDGMIEHGGAVALFRESHVDVQENQWYKEWRTVTERYAKDDPARARRHDSRWPSHEQVLLSSPFSQLELVSVVGRRQSTIDGLIERARSMSSLARERIGDRAAELERDLSTLLTSVPSMGGLVTEVLEWTALIARRG
ncbi:MAG: class I SAM-dependent methyltransferase [Xanthobacteraceae bacterium]|nr:class I SAM-dependent methyltransferase [Xanthobacteraceae bacterium]MBV9236616.1 class I SAM-dependent methyltransferase [Xanthobacteraceae bacterium]MBV9630461.1 class I SAM-dependent methyltransferase [Xanthobacteraceae bacterium]